MQNIHQLKYMEAKELCYYMIELLYSIEVDPLNFGTKFIVATFKQNTHRAIHIIAIYMPSFLSLTTFLFTLKKLISKFPPFFPQLF